VRVSVIVAAVAVATGCSDAKPGKPAAAPAAPARAEPDPTQWRCFIADPHNAANPAGNVTHLKHRILPERFETQNVNIQNGVRTKQTDTLPRVGDHYENHEYGATSTVTLDAADGTHWTYHFRDDTGYEWFDESIVDDHGLTSTATDPGPDGGWVKTTIHFLAAPCYIVDAELAKY
jgi:hypothetical protein